MSRILKTKFAYFEILLLTFSYSYKDHSLFEPKRDKTRLVGIHG